MIDLRGWSSHVKQNLTPETRRPDYSLVGRDAALAVEKGLAEAKWWTPSVPKERMRELLERRDGPAIRDTVLWLGLLFVSGLGGYVLWGTWWAIVPFSVYGVIYASTSDSRWHESGHGTAFKTDWLNNALYEMASFMVLRESIPWRWSHTRHHTDTIIVGRDPEIAVPRPVNPALVVLKFFNGVSLPRYVRNVLLHCRGKLTPEELTYIPDSEHGRVFLRARIYVLIYGGVIAMSVIAGSVLPFMYVGLPNLFGAWLMVVYGLTQHAGLAEDVLDHRLNTRTVYMNRIHRYLYWNMGYHLEHHLFPLVPYHALPKLHELVKADLPTPYDGLIEAYREIIPTLWRQSKDPIYHVKRQLPARAGRPAPPHPRFIAEGKPIVEGWVEVCDSTRLRKEDVLRFDHDGKTFAIYRTADDRVYATDGICTHGNAHLADGLLKRTLIECPKHNGRFDIRDGSPRRPPVCVAVRTYEVRETNGKILFNSTSAPGSGLAETANTYTFQVVSNRNIATFIKELVLAPEGLSPALIYQPGDYAHFEIPAYADRSLHDADVSQPYADIWRAQQVFDLRAYNPMACRRNYSMASNPAKDDQLRFNVRLATPPPGLVAKAGVGSSYIFGLKPGDKIGAVGPFGAFHIKQTEREMVYLGGGAGMAPLRSHLSYLLETQKTTRRVSYWYGARSLQELFYQDYFEDLAGRNSNFTFHVALSEPRPEDQWKSHTGFIHDVLKQNYLDSHPDPTQIEYYLCGPLAMVRAAIGMLVNLGVDPAQIAGDEF
jgi:Na+-transporting NADH:ubiquinone oxidoreductase subunit F